MLNTYFACPLRRADLCMDLSFAHLCLPSPDRILPITHQCRRAIRVAMVKVIALVIMMISMEIVMWMAIAKAMMLMLVMAIVAVVIAMGF